MHKRDDLVAIVTFEFGLFSVWRKGRVRKGGGETGGNNRKIKN
jgi:hypothetical protein